MASSAENVVAAIALLPADGAAIPYADFRNSAIMAGIPLSSTIKLIRKSAQVEFGFVTDSASGELVHVVKRNIEGGSDGS